MRSERPSGPVLRHVRAVTGGLHDALDASVEGQAILAGRVTRASYLRMLNAHLSLHQYVADCTGRLLSQDKPQRLLDWPDCPRLDALQADLARLDAQARRHQSSPPLPAVISVSFACGLLYVVEGACHGTGQMLRALKKNQEFVGWAADAFMTLSREGIATRWPATVALLEQHGEHDLDGVAQGAVTGFECYRAAAA